jgi:hypothetical protein
MHEGEGDEMKARPPRCCLPRAHSPQRIFVEGDPVLLAITGCVSVLHTVFDMLRHTPPAFFLPCPLVAFTLSPPSASRTTSPSGRA